MTLPKIIHLLSVIKKGLECRPEPNPLDADCIEKIDEVIRELRKCRQHLDRVREGLDEV